jgi:hypothetical protein
MMPLIMARRLLFAAVVVNVVVWTCVLVAKAQSLHAASSAPFCLGGFLRGALKNDGDWSAIATASLGISAYGAAVSTAAASTSGYSRSVLVVVGSVGATVGGGTRTGHRNRHELLEGW